MKRPSDETFARIARIYELVAELNEVTAHLHNSNVLVELSGPTSRDPLGQNFGIRIDMRSDVVLAERGRL